jgi:hypothetical protein
MSDLPKLKVKWFVEPFRETTINFEEAKYSLPFGPPYNLQIVLDGQLIYSYDELLQLATAAQNKDKQVLEIVVLSPVGGG